MNYKKLLVWQKSMDLLEHVYKLLQSLSKNERYALADQLRRSAVSVPSNIAEGSHRGSDKEFVHFLYIALGSLAEMETQLLIAERVGYFKGID